MVIVEGMISHKVFAHQVEITHEQLDKITCGLAKAASIVLAVYFAIKVMGIALDDEWHLLGTSWGRPGAPVTRTGALAASPGRTTSCTRSLL